MGEEFLDICERYQKWLCVAYDDRVPTTTFMNDDVPLLIRIVADLRAELERAQAESARMHDDLVRALAEERNTVKRLRKEGWPIVQECDQLRSQLEACRALNGKLFAIACDMRDSKLGRAFAGACERFDAFRAIATTVQQAGREWAAMREAVEDARQLLSALEQFDIRAGAKGGLVLGERKVLWEHSLTDRLRASLAKVDASREGKL